MTEKSDDPLTFPRRWPGKAMVETGKNALRDVLDVIGRHAELPAEDEEGIRPSRTGRYESITVVIEAQSREQLETIYGELKDVLVVSMTLWFLRRGPGQLF